MRKFTTFAFALAGVAMLSVPSAAQTAAPLKIGYINSQKLIDQAPGSAEVKVTLQKELASWKAQVDAMQDSIQTMVKDFESKSVLLSPDAKQKRQDDILNKEATFKTRVAEIQTRASTRQSELLTPIMDKVQAAITALRTAEGYAIIFDASTEAMVAADPALDLTDKVLARLKAPAPAPTAGKN
ncbi:MAG: OmpH family outer membrane protein [Longimicrobiales bacterium]